MKSSFTEGLVSNGPAEDYKEKLMLYGQFIGDWTADTIEYLEDGSQKYSKWDIRFERVLERRIVQNILDNRLEKKKS